VFEENVMAFKQVHSEMFSKEGPQSIGHYYRQIYSKPELLRAWEQRMTPLFGRGKMTDNSSDPLPTISISSYADFKYRQILNPDGYKKVCTITIKA
jgi:hypothetical protein